MRRAILTRRERLRADPGLVLRAIFAAALVGMSFGGCADQISKHGYLIRESDVQQVQPGMAQEQVRQILGTPTTTTTAGTGNVYYYISSTHKKSAMWTSSEIDRQVIGVYFNPTGLVERVANYGMKDGKVFDTISRTTPAPGSSDEGILKQLFRNLGTKQIFGE